MRCELVPPMSTSYFHRERCGGELRGDPSLTMCQDFELWLRLSDHEILRSTAVLGATRLSEKSMSRTAELYERFSAEKITALEGSSPSDLELQPERDAAVAGIYCWAAESLLGIEGPGPRSRRSSSARPPSVPTTSVFGNFAAGPPRTRQADGSPLRVALTCSSRAATAQRIRAPPAPAPGAVPPPAAPR